MGRIGAASLRKPLRQPLLDVSVTDHPAGFNIGETLLDLLTDVNVVLNVLESRVFGQGRKDLLDLLLGCLHRDRL